MAPPFRDITGQRFGKLIAVRPMETSRTNRKDWLFKCDCGNEKITSAYYVVRKERSVSSCGCLEVERIRNMVAGRKAATMPNQMGAKNKLFGRYRTQAKSRGIAFDLPKDRFLELIAMNCTYCQAPPNSVIYPKYDNKDLFCIYTGIDRRDSSLGYSEENCVPCCGTCNRMKSDMPVDDFINHVIKIVQNMGVINERQITKPV